MHYFYGQNFFADSIIFCRQHYFFGQYYFLQTVLISMDSIDVMDSITCMDGINFYGMY